MTDIFSNGNKFEWFIPHNVAALKNGKIPVTKASKKQVGKFFTRLVPSASATKYQRASKAWWQAYARSFRDATADLERPLIIEFQLFRSTRRKFDYTNALDMVQDMMVEHGWIDDDNADELWPILLHYEHNPEQPGVLIRISDNNLK